MAIDGVGGSQPPPPPAPSRPPEEGRGGGSQEDPFAGEPVEGDAAEAGGGPPAGDTVDLSSMVDEGGAPPAPDEGVEGDDAPSSFNADGSVNEGDMGGALDELI